MLPKHKDLLLKEKVKLYNNITKLNDCEGRLLAELEVYPTPRIVWEFEILGNVQCDFPYLASWKSDQLNPLIGHLFSIKEPRSNGGSSDLGPLEAIRGSAAQALYGDMEAMEAVAHKFIFYLPNTRFQSISVRQDRLIKSLRETGSDREVGLGEEGRYIKSPVDDIWSINLDVRTDALAWLDRRNRNTGTLITTVGQLYQPKYNATEPETFDELQTITLKNSLERIKDLSQFLSYANGGYIGPLYIEGLQYTQDQSDPVQTCCAVALAFQTTPLEQLCSSWLTNVSDLRVYMKCLAAFERMMQNQSWKETFDFTLAQYFQATKPMTAWQVAASATGAALERLTYTILVEEETNSTKKADCELLFDIRQGQAARQRWNLGINPGQEDISVTGKRLRLLLECIGLTKSRGYNDIDDVQSFLDVRNDAVHPRVGNMTLEQRWQYIKQGIQWIDEVLLWRFGYSSEYLDRIQKGLPTTPRYDLSLRDSSW
jgi:hypothetical protein